MVKWRVTSMCALLMAVGFWSAPAGIVGSWLFVLASGKFKRELIPVAVVFSATYLSLKINVGDITAKFIIAIALLIALIAASIRLNATLGVMSINKRTRLIVWGGKAVLWGAVTFGFFVGLYIMVAGFLMIAVGALRP